MVSFTQKGHSQSCFIFLICLCFNSHLFSLEEEVICQDRTNITSFRLLINICIIITKALNYAFTVTLYLFLTKDKPLSFCQTV